MVYLRVLVVGIVVRADLKILDHGHLWEDPPPFRHVTDPELDGLVCREARDVSTVEADRAPRRVVQSRDHPQRRRLAGTVRAEQSDDLTLVDRDREVVQSRDSAVADLRACHLQERHQSTSAPVSVSLSGVPR